MRTSREGGGGGKKREVSILPAVSCQPETEGGHPLEGLLETFRGEKEKEKKIEKKKAASPHLSRGPFQLERKG